MRLRRLLAAVFATLLGLSGLGLSSATTGVASADPAACPKIYVLAVPGTWSSNRSPGIMSAVTAGLGADTKVDFVGYDATAFPWESAIYGKSKAQAVANIKGLALTMLKKCPGTKIALTGYSQGADAAGDVASEIGSGRAEIKPQQVAGVVLIADPRRSKRDNLVGPPLTGQGSGGPRAGGMGWLLPNAFTICEPADLYCNVPRDYYVTRIVGYLAETSDPTPSQFAQYQASAALIFAELASGGIANVPRELSNQRAREQIIKFNSFIESGAHGNYNRFEVTPGVTAVQWAHNYLAGLG